METPAQASNESTKLYYERREKLIYFLMASAGAAIGFIITRIENEKIDYIYISYLFSAILFSISFIYGYFSLSQITAVNRANANLYGELHRDQNNPMAQKALDISSQKIFPKLDRSLRHREGVQFYTIIIGSLFYIMGPLINSYMQGKLPNLLALFW